MTLPILIVEDEVKIAELLRDYCEQAGYSTVMVHDGSEALAWIDTHRARIVLLDLMLPGTDGFSICRHIQKTSETPVIMISARVEEIDRLLGLELGADDYVCKPFSPREVIARVKTILRRIENPGRQDTGFRLDPDALRVGYGEKVIDLTSVEFNLFKTLHDNPGRIYSRDHLMSMIYRDNRIVTDRTIDSHVKKLRRKLGELGSGDDPVHSVYGVGYKFE